MQYIIIVILGMASTPSGRIEERAPSPSEFVTMYRAALERHEAAHQGIQLRATEVNFNRKKQSSSTRTLLFAKNRHRERFAWINTTPSGGTPLGAERVFVTDGGKDFTVERDSPSQGYRLIRKNDDVASYINSYKQYHHSAAVSMGERTLAGWMDLPGFRVRETSWRASEGEENLLQVDLSLEQDKPRATTTGWMLLDPRRDWAIRKYELDVVIPGSSVGVYRHRFTGEVRYPASGGAFPEEVVTESHDSNHEYEDYQVTVHIDQISLDPPPERDFTLTAFGLGDADRPYTGSRDRLFGWGSGVALASAALATAFARLGRRRRASE